jgi:predicted PurR-regulated permease PerM
MAFSPSSSTFSTPHRWQRAFYVPLTILAWLAVLVVVGWLLSHVIRTLVMIALGGILAIALAPLVTVLSRWLPRLLAIAGAYVLGLAVMVGLGTLLVSTTATEVVNLVASLPAYAKQEQQLEPQLAAVLGPLGITSATLQSITQQAFAELQQIGATLAAGSVALLTGIAGVAIDIVLTLMLSIYFLANGSRLVHWLEHSVPRGQRRYARLFVGIVRSVLGGYIRGTLTLATLIGVLVGGGLLILGVPYAVLLGVLAFFMEFVPVIGVLISGAVSVLVALFHGWALALAVLGYFVIVHVIEGDVVGPRIVGKAVGIHPATSLIALLAGTELFGIWGALFASPVAGLLQAIATAAWPELTGGATDLDIPLAAERAPEAVETRGETGSAVAGPKGYLKSEREREQAPGPAPTESGS